MHSTDAYHLVGLVRVPVHCAHRAIVPPPITLPVVLLLQLEAPLDDVVVEQVIVAVVEDGRLPGAPVTTPQVMVAPGASSTVTCRFWMVEQLAGIMLKEQACIV